MFKYMFKNKSMFLPSSVKLTLSRQKGNMGSAHPFVEENIWTKI